MTKQLRSIVINLSIRAVGVASVVALLQKHLMVKDLLGWDLHMWLGWLENVVLVAPFRFRFILLLDALESWQLFQLFHILFEPIAWWTLGFLAVINRRSDRWENLWLPWLLVPLPPLLSNRLLKSLYLHGLVDYLDQLLLALHVKTVDADILLFAHNGCRWGHCIIYFSYLSEIRVMLGLVN